MVCDRCGRALKHPVRVGSKTYGATCARKAASAVQMELWEPEPMPELNPQQFTNAHVHSAVPGYNASMMEDRDFRRHQQNDIYTRKLIPVNSVYDSMGSQKTPLAHNPVNEQAGKYFRAMEEGDAHKFPPVVVAESGTPGRYDHLDGGHRLQAARLAQITHAAAYVRKRPIDTPPG